MAKAGWIGPQEAMTIVQVGSVAPWLTTHAQRSTATADRGCKPENLGNVLALVQRGERA